MSEIRLSEVRDLFSQELTFPTTSEEIITATGDVALYAPGGENESISDVLDRSETEEFQSIDELFDTFMMLLSEEYVGRRKYDDRGTNPGYSDEVSL